MRATNNTAISAKTSQPGMAGFDRARLNTLSLVSSNADTLLAGMLTDRDLL